MDFAAPEPIRAVLYHFVEHGVLGYEFPTRELRETVAARMQTLYGWQVSPDAVVATPGVVAGFTLAANAVCAAGQGLLIQPPVYPPFLKVNGSAGLVRQEAPLVLETDGNTLRYSVDFDIFQKAVHSDGAKTGMFLFCNPHNPTGQIYTKDDLARIADICLKNNIFICSDEIHSEILLGGTQHIPIAALDPEIADHTITLIAPSKLLIFQACSADLRSSQIRICSNAIRRRSSAWQCTSAVPDWWRRKLHFRVRAMDGWQHCDLI